MSDDDNDVRRSAALRRRLYRFLRSIPTWVLWLLVGVWLTPDDRTAGQLLPRLARSRRTSGWWTVFLGNFGGLTLENYRTVLGTSINGGMRTGVDELDGDRPAGDDHPDRHRRLRRLRLRLDRLPRPRRTCSSPPWRCWRSRCRSPSSRCCRCTPVAPTGRSRGSTRRSPCSPTSISTGRRRRCGSRTRRSVCRSPSSCCTTTSRRCPATCSRRRGSTAPTTSRSSGVSSCRCRCR